MITGAVTIPVMGTIADQQLPDALPQEEVVALLENAASVLPASFATTPEARHTDIQQAIDLTQESLAGFSVEGVLPGTTTANALRAITSSGVEDPVVENAAALLGPAENYGGRISFRYVAPLSLIIIAVFGVLYMSDRRAGGYRAERIGAEDQGIEPEWAGSPSR